MNYPQEKFEILKSCVSVMSEHIEVKKSDPTFLHDFIVSQFSPFEQEQRMMVNKEGSVIRRSRLFYFSDEEASEFRPLLSLLTDDEIVLTHTPCNQEDIPLAVNKAIQELNL